MRTDGHCLEYWARCRASPIQPEVEKEKEKKKEAPSFKLQAASPRPALMMPQLKDINNLERNI
jgi:hypothetical protein